MAKTSKEYHAERSAKRRAAGQCVKCGEASPDKARCDECLRKDAERQKDRQRKLTEQGLCKQCGKAPVKEGHLYCEPCLAKTNAATRKGLKKKRENGCCISCGRPCGKTARCKECNRKSNAAVVETRKRWQEAGKCRNCGADAIPTTRSMRTDRDRSNYCRNCYLRVCAQTVLGSGKRWQELLAKLDACGWRCYYTGETLVLGDNLSFDHLDPVSRFPERRADLANVVPCTWQVNLMKRDLTEKEFLELAERILACKRQRE